LTPSLPKNDTNAIFTAAHAHCAVDYLEIGAEESGAVALALVIGTIASAAQDEGRMRDFDGAVASVMPGNSRIVPSSKGRTVLPSMA
jgi:hypothetical protein